MKNKKRKKFNERNKLLSLHIKRYFGNNIIGEKYGL